MRPRLTLSICLRVLMAYAAIAASGAALSQNLEDLLRETERALEPTKSKKQKSAAEDDEEEAKKQKSNRRKTQKAGTPTPQPLPSAESSSEQAAKPVLTPTDAESVNELISVGLRKEAQLRPDSGERNFALAVGAARLTGTHELEKDDDTFTAKRAQRLPGVSLAFTTDLGSPISLGSWLSLRPIGRIGAGFLKGQVQVERRGIQNDVIEPEYSLIPAMAALGLRNVSESGWRVSAAYGPAVELLIQTGEGTSDSTSGFFFADAFDLAIERRLTDALWIGLMWQARGLAPLTGREAGHQMLALSINTPLAG